MIKNKPDYEQNVQYHANAVEKYAKNSYLCYRSSWTNAPDIMFMFMYIYEKYVY